MITENTPLPSEISVAGGQFMYRLKVEAEYLEQSPTALGGSIFALGRKMISLNPGEQIVLRDSAGFEEPLDLMDDRFKPSEPQVDENIEPQELVTSILPNSRQAYHDATERFGIDLEELGGRILNAGLSAALEARVHGKRLMMRRGFQVEDMPFIDTPKNKAMQKLKGIDWDSLDYDYSGWDK